MEETIRGQQQLRLMAQCKYIKDSSLLRKALRDVRYDGYQKIVPADRPVPGAMAQVSAGGVSSTPLTLIQGDRMVTHFVEHFDASRPRVAAVAVRNAALGGAAGGALGAATVIGGVIGSAMGLPFKATGVGAELGERTGVPGCDVGDGGVVAAMLEAVVVGAAAVGIGAALYTVTTRGLTGCVSAGAVGALYGLLRCEDVACRGREAVAGLVGVVAGGCVMGLCPRKIARSKVSVKGTGLRPLVVFIASWEAHRLAASAGRWCMEEGQGAVGG